MSRVLEIIEAVHMPLSPSEKAQIHGGNRRWIFYGIKVLRNQLQRTMAAKDI